MTATNLPPTVNGGKFRGMSFPFRRGGVGFPAPSSHLDSVYNSIVSLLNTGKNERVMRTTMGVTVNRYVFETITPILMAQLASDVTTEISRWEPRARVISVLADEEVGDDGTRIALKISVIYEIGGQVNEQQVFVPVTPKG